MCLKRVHDTSEFDRTTRKTLQTHHRPPVVRNATLVVYDFAALTLTQPNDIRIWETVAHIYYCSKHF